MTLLPGRRSTNLAQAIQNSFFSLLSLACRLVGTSLIFVIIARLPGISVAEFGQLTYATALAGLFVMVSQYGFAPLLVRDIAADGALLKSHAQSTAFLRTLFSIAGLAALIAYVFVIDMSSQGRWICVVLAVAYYIGAFSIDIQALFQSREKMHLELVGVAIENGLLIALAALAFFLQPSVTQVAYIFLFTKLSAFLVNYATCGRTLLWVLPVPDRSLCARLLWEATPFALTGIIALGIVQLDTILLRELSSGDPEASVGLYQAAVRLFLVPMLLPQIVLKVFLPQLSRMHGKQGAGLVRDLGKVNHILMTLGLLIGLVTLVRGEDIIRLFYGEKLAGAGPLLQMFGVTLMMRFGMAYNLYFTIRNRIWFRVVSALLALAALVLLDFLLIPAYGPMGAAYASIGAHVVYWILYFGALYRAERTILLGWKILRAGIAALALAAMLQGTASFHIGYMLPIYGLVVLVATFLVMAPEDRGKVLDQFNWKVTT
jgi:O-antigen/teichoic acid export membrane protein